MLTFSLSPKNRTRKRYATSFNRSTVKFGRNNGLKVMLERTAGCFENAGRRFLRDANGIIRNRTTLRAKLGHDGGSISDSSPLSVPDRRTVQGQDSNRAASQTTSGLTSDSRPLLLDFLYPDRTQEFVVTRLLRSTRNLLLRRKRKGGFVVSRPFVSQAGFDQEDALPHSADSRQSETTWVRDSLTEILAEGITGQSERAWQLYLLAGQPPDLNSALLAQFCKVRATSGHSRAKLLFDSIPQMSRSVEDYWNLTNSYILARQSGELGRICREAAENGLGLTVGSLVLARSINKSEWDLAQDIWENLRAVDETELWEHLVPRLHASTLQPRLLDLAMLLDRRAKDTAGSSSSVELVPSFARFFFDKVLAFPSEFVESFHIDTLLLLIDKLHSTAILTRDHFYGIIKTLQVSKKRSTFTKSILIYRNFQWLVDTMVPTKKLYDRFLRQLLFFKMAAGVEYFLHEFSRFHERPSAYAYKKALSILSRSAEPPKVEAVFGKFVDSWGKPTSVAFVTPLLYVYAKAGNVKETLAQFERISNEFGLEPDHICWNTVLTAYANAGKLTESFAHFRRMLEEGIEVNSHTFGILMGLCSKRGDTNAVHQLLELARQHSIQTTSALFDPIVEAHCNAQEFEQAEAFAESCLSLDMTGSRLRMWNILLRNYAYRLDVDSISRVRSRMDAAGLRPDEMTYAALMLSLVLLGQTDAARRILRTLHRSRQMQVTELHYAIILYGYFRDHNRAMTQVIFEEMEKRYEHAGLTLQLFRLRDQLQLDLRLEKEQLNATPGTRKASVELPINSARKKEPFPDLHFAHAEETLAEIIGKFDSAKPQVKQPAPGAGNQPIARAFPAMFYESVAREYAKKGAYRKVEQLIEEYGKSQGLSLDDALDIAPLRLHAALMHAYSISNQHEKLLACWEKAFRLARNSGSHITEFAPFAEDANMEPEEAPVLPASRYVLSRHFSLYIKSLAHTKQRHRIDDMVRDFQNAGFSMTTYNWSTYVQLFSLSADPTENLQAFSIFEDNFMPNFPGWKYLRRGKALAHSEAPSAIRMLEKPENRPPPGILGPIGKKYWSQHHPQVMQPTYISLIYLASALVRIRKESALKGPTHLVDLHKAAPNTLKAISAMPWLRDKWQSIFLRGREKKPEEDYPSLPKKKRFVWSGGVLGVGGNLRKLRRAETYGYITPQKAENTQSRKTNKSKTPSDKLPTTDKAPTQKTTKEACAKKAPTKKTRRGRRKRSTPYSDSQLSSQRPISSQASSINASTRPLGRPALSQKSTNLQQPDTTNLVAIGAEDEMDLKIESQLYRRRQAEFKDDPARAIIPIDPDALPKPDTTPTAVTYDDSWVHEVPAEREIHEPVPCEPGQYVAVPDEPAPSKSDSDGQSDNSSHPNQENPHQA
ncbi:hypothetical protein BJX70DRAFT_364000 [Aspergillus crustosus]